MPYTDAARTFAGTVRRLRNAIEAGDVAAGELLAIEAGGQADALPLNVATASRVNLADLAERLYAMGGGR